MKSTFSLLVSCTFVTRAFGHESKQVGQILWLALMLLVFASVGLSFLVSAGLLIADKSRLRDAADSAAFSAAVWRARVLNFNAYSNRAIIAQEIAVAQTLSLLSWARYFESLSANAAELADRSDRSHLPASLASLGRPDVVQAAQRTRAALEQAAALELWLRAAPESGYKHQLAATQELMHRSARVFGLGAVANEVVRAIDARFFAFALPDQGEFDALTERYSTTQERQRLARVVQRALDPFVAGPRELDLSFTLFDPCEPRGPVQPVWIRKRGGTALSADLERWLAIDTASIHLETPLLLQPENAELCTNSERFALGWGAAISAGSAAQFTADISHAVAQISAQATDATRISPQARARAVSASEVGAAGSALDLEGITSVRELSASALSRSEPTSSTFAVLARIDQRRLSVSRLSNMFAGRLNRVPNLPGDRVWALSAASAYFRRPKLDSSLDTGNANDAIEYASLFSPYWQARLIEPSQEQRATANSYAN